MSLILVIVELGSLVALLTCRVVIASIVYIASGCVSSSRRYTAFAVIVVFRHIESLSDESSQSDSRNVAGFSELRRVFGGLDQCKLQ